ncbi:MAG: DUF3102 domain-containing protein [Pleurocapsa minor HA4230-MV1]|jgi:DNA-binding NarL/FixJ family response regulator|nr:DUF3102 domain-containing protein [Pleurocapsa minor HA4230-MV1]
MKVKNKDKENLVLIVDDEICTSKFRKKDVLRDLELPAEQVLFAANYEEALKLWEKNDIAICYVDYRIPRNNEPYDYQEIKDEWKNKGWGLAFISYLSSLNHNTSIVVYSAYVDKAYLQNQAEEFEDRVTAFYGKPNYQKNYRKQHYLDAIKTLETRKESVFDYHTLDETTQTFIHERTQNIRVLIADNLANSMKIGKYMLDIKAKLEHGQFLGWLNFEFGESFGYHTANRFMTLYDRFKDYNIKDLSNIKISALYNLAKVPDELVEEVINDVKSGKSTINVESSKKLLTEYRKQRKLGNSLSQTEPTEIVEKSTVTNELQIVQAASTAITSAKEQILKVIRQPQKSWNIDQHSVFALEPSSNEFINKLSQTVSLCLSFPPVANWQCPFNSTTQNIFYSHHDDLDNMELLKMVDQAVSLSTDRSDIVVVCYIPHPGILSVIDNLECKAIIVDPDLDKCLELVEFYNQVNSRST